MNKNKINLIASLWFFAQIVLEFVYISLIPAFGILASLVFWQILTEIGYFLAFRMGFHSTPDGKRISNGKSGRMPFPDFVENSESYLEKKMNLTTYERLMRLVFSLTFSGILTVYFIIFTGFTEKMIELGKWSFYFFYIGIILLAYLSWKGYQLFFAYVFKLEIAWKENNRPIFVKKRGVISK